MSYRYEYRYAIRPVQQSYCIGRNVYTRTNYQYGWGFDYVWKPSTTRPLTAEEIKAIVDMCAVISEYVRKKWNAMKKRIVLLYNKFF